MKLTLNTKLTGVELIPRKFIKEQVRSHLHFITIKNVIDQRRLPTEILRIKLEQYGELNQSLKDYLEYRQSLNNVILN